MYVLLADSEEMHECADFPNKMDINILYVYSNALLILCSLCVMDDPLNLI